MARLKVMTVIGTRPEIIRLSRVIACLDRNTDHVLVHTGQNYDYELNEIFFRDLQIRKPDHFLEAAGKSAAETIGQLIIRIDPVLEAEKPDALLVLGDTNSGLSVLAAKRRKIPIFHMEAGNRCFDQRVPEEINRRIIDHTADINLTYSSIAREYLLAEGLPADLVIKTGSPMFEVLNYYRSGIDQSRALATLGLEVGGYFLLSAHREETVDDEHQLKRLADALTEITVKYNKPILFSAHPRTRARLEKFDIAMPPLVQVVKPLGYFDYVALQCNAHAVLSDSGTISEEASILGFPAVNIREAHERPEAMEEAAVMLTGLNPSRILQALDILSRQGRGAQSVLRTVSDYSAPNVSEKVLRLILSYTDYVNRTVWKKY